MRSGLQNLVTHRCVKGIPVGMVSIVLVSLCYAADLRQQNGQSGSRVQSGKYAAYQLQTITIKESAVEFRPAGARGITVSVGGNGNNSNTAPFEFGLDFDGALGNVRALSVRNSQLSDKQALIVVVAAAISEDQQSWEYRMLVCRVSGVVKSADAWSYSRVLARRPIGRPYDALSAIIIEGDTVGILLQDLSKWRKQQGVIETKLILNPCPAAGPNQEMVGDFKVFDGILRPENPAHDDNGQISSLFVPQPHFLCDDQTSDT